MNCFIKARPYVELNAVLEKLQFSSREPDQLFAETST
jgi:hypothetical protein